MATPHKILLITTGGTIAGQVASDKTDKQMIRTGDQFTEIIMPTINYLNRRLDLEIDVHPHSLCDIDSSDVLPKHWRELVDLVTDNYDIYDSFIITHGTNTLGYTCAAMSFALANLNKPVILTGSQVPAGLPGTDGLTNLSNAMRVAVWKREKNPIKGVLAVFGSHIITGTRVKKDTEFDYDAFKSFGVGSVGRIGRIININETSLSKHLGYLSTGEYPAARTASDLVCENHFDMSIASLTEFPGMSPKIFQTLVERENIRGFILRSFGAGDASTNLRSAFEYLRTKEIPIVVTTQAPNGNSNFQVNEPGKYLRDHNLAIPAFDMSLEAQTTKLAWLLAKRNKDELTYKELCVKMRQDLRGEINVLWEVGV
jgi:L-asparaginase